MPVERGEPAGQAEAGVVHQQVDPIAMRGEVGHQSRRRAQRRQVDGYRSGMAELGCEGVEPLLAPRDENQAIPLRRQLAREIDTIPPTRR